MNKEATACWCLAAVLVYELSLDSDPVKGPYPNIIAQRMGDRKATYLEMMERLRKWFLALTDPDKSALKIRFIDYFLEQNSGEVDAFDPLGEAPVVLKEAIALAENLSRQITTHPSK